MPSPVPYPILGIFFYALAIMALVFAVGSLVTGQPAGAIIGLIVSTFAAVIARADRVRRMPNPVRK